MDIFAATIQHFYLPQKAQRSRERALREKALRRPLATVLERERHA